MKFENIKPGDILYDCHMHRIGNTACRAMGVWTVRIISVEPQNMAAIVSWNGNSPQKWYSSTLRKLRKHPPEWLKDSFNGAKCYYCRRKQSEGHADTCEHPRAVAARKRAQKQLEIGCG